MKEHFFNKEKGKALAKHQALKRLPILLFAGFGGLFIADQQSDGQVFGDPLVLYGTIAIGLFGLGTGFFIGIKNASKALLLNKFVLTEDSISRQMPTGKIHEICFVDLEKITENSDGLLIKDRNKTIQIPKQLENYEELHQVLMGVLK